MAMVEEGDLVLVFHSLHRVLEAERCLLDRQLPILLIPAPRQISGDCAMAIRLAPAAAGAVWAVLSEENLLSCEAFQCHAESFYQVDPAGFSP